MSNQTLKFELYTPKSDNPVIWGSQYEKGKVDTIKLYANGQPYKLGKLKAELLAIDREGNQYRQEFVPVPGSEEDFLITYPDTFFSSTGLFNEARIVVYDGNQILQAVGLAIIVQPRTLNESSNDFTDDLKSKLEKTDTISLKDSSSVEVTKEDLSVILTADAIPVAEYKSGMANIWIYGKLSDIRKAFAKGGNFSTGSLVIKTPSVIYSASAGGSFSSTYSNGEVISQDRYLSVYVQKNNAANQPIGVTNLMLDNQFYQGKELIPLEIFASQTQLIVSNGRGFTDGAFFTDSAVSQINNLLSVKQVQTLPTPSISYRKFIYLTPDDKVWILNNTGKDWLQLN